MFDQILNLLYSGIVYGSVLSLISLGFSLLYGVGKILNLAHGFFYVLTGYLAFWVLPVFNYNIWLTISVALILITLISGAVYLVLIKPLQESELNVVLITFALAFFMEQFIRFAWGSEYKTIYQLIIFQGTTDFAGLSIINQSVFLVIVSLILIAVFTLFLNKSKLGRSIRAVSQDREAAQLMGINSNRILFYAVMISGFLAGVAALLYLPNFTLDPGQGWSRLTDAFAVVILGGMGSLMGSFVGAYIIAFANSFTTIFFPPYGAAWSHVVPIILILIMLIIRPRGIFGKKEIL
jgi:branched-chain amino acid transport system permease protein